MILELAGIFFASFLIGFSGALVPGPLLTVTITEVTKKGFIAGPLVVFGHAASEAVIVLAIVFGLTEILKSDFVSGAIGIFGGGILLWMGYNIFFNAYKKRVRLDLSSREKSSPRLAGVLASISNPYWELWWVSVGAAFILKALNFGFLGLISFYVGHILSDFTWYSLVALAIAYGKNLFSQSMYRGILMFCGVFLMVFSFYFLYSGLNFIF